MVRVSPHRQKTQRQLREVYAEEQRRLAVVVRRAFSAEADGWERILAGCAAMLEATLEPGVRRITLVEAPAALGWTDMRDIQAGCKEQLPRGWAS
ncbi:hypothetical protein ABZ801_34415 [Actinomadura sp. NPDC047616]|uniref:hypothetical protein n=1 Tax=Actinomadura sp. NPDC047616 TaxID=3155914 RepID=UPI00340E2092